MVLGPFSAQGAVWNVSSLTELQDALAVAMDNGEDDTIYIAAGTYSVTSPLTYNPSQSVAERDDNHALIVEGAGAEQTIFDGGGTSRLFSINTVNLQYAPEGGDAPADVTLRNIGFTNGNGGTGSGGAVLAYTSSADLLLEGCRFSGNQAGSGGAIYGDTQYGTITVDGTSLEGNVSTSNGGGAYLSTYDGRVVVTDSLVQNNTGGSGSGLYASANSGDVEILRTVVDANNTNETYIEGAGIYVDAYSGVALLADNIVSRNTGGSGTGMQVLGRSPGFGLVLTNNTITSNTSQNFGGAGVVVSLQDWENPSTQTARIANNILWGNDGGQDLYLSYYLGQAIQLDNNLWGSWYQGCNPCSAVLDGNFSEDPLFVDEENGDFHLQLASPCLDAGSPGALDPLQTADVDGDTRSLDGDGDGVALPEIGADELVQSGSVDVALQPDSIGFGIVTPGRSRSLTFRVYNHGDVSMSLQDLRITGADTGVFFESHTAQRVAPGTWADVTVAFEPTAVGVYTAALEIDTADADTPTAVAALSGYCREPAVFHVSSTGDDLQTGDTWSTALQSLQAAVDRAVDGDILWVKAGSYGAGSDHKGIVIDKALALYGGFQGDETRLEERDWVLNETIVNGALGFTSHVFHLRGDVVLDGFTITGGHAYNYPTEEPEKNKGGGIYAESGDIVVENCTITDNRGDYGGGAYLLPGANVTFRNCRIENNTATYFGGGIHDDTYGTDGTTSHVTTIVDSTLSGNVASGADTTPGLGGAVYAYAYYGNASQVRMKNCTVDGNQATMGGGLYVTAYSTTDYRFFLTGSEVINNTASIDGGGIYNYGNALSAVNCRITGNRALNNHGGGVYNGDSSSPSFVNTVFAGNQVSMSSSKLGGAVFLSRYGSARFDGCIFTENRAYWGSAIGCAINPSPTPIIRNAVIWGNIASYDGYEAIYSQSGPSVAYTLIEQDSYAGTNNNINIDPLFAIAGNWDGDTWTAGDYQLQVSSPAIDAGDNNEVSADNNDLDDDGDTGEAVPLDLFGDPRFTDVPGVTDTGAGTPPITDMGADEYLDTDGDGTQDGIDNCPAAANAEQGNLDGDEVGDVCDDCPDDPDKTEPGTCGCGVPETDSDANGTPDCEDPDDDGDGTPDGDDLCPLDGGKTAPGICGCGTPDVDGDSDGTLDCQDGCPTDGGKIAPGTCGCGIADLDGDADGVEDCRDRFPGDGTEWADTDGDGWGDGVDGCPDDPEKTEPALCGCGVAEVDTEGDGIPDCLDAFPNTPVQAGDVNNSGGPANLTDGVLLLQMLVDAPLPATLFFQADADGDNRLGVGDVIYILQGAAAMP